MRRSIDRSIDVVVVVCRVYRRIAVEFLRRRARVVSCSKSRDDETNE
jgi:hypothetical protein